MSSKPKLDGIDANMRAACESFLAFIEGHTEVDLKALSLSENPKEILEGLQKFLAQMNFVTERIYDAVVASHMKEEAGGKLPPVGIQTACATQPLGMYEHRASKELYIVLGMAFCAETSMPLVIYVPYANPKMSPFARSVYDFNAIVDGGVRFKRVASKQCPSCLRTMPTDVNCDCPPFNHAAFQQEIKNVVPAESLRESQGPTGPQEGQQTVGT